MKKLLIISPSFPPVNAADMQRVRQSLPYFEQFGYKTTVVAVNPVFNEHVKDEILTDTVSKVTNIIWVNAFATSWTRKIGLGSLGLRSMWFYWLAVNKLLKSEKFDLIYFSTTMFPVMILGKFWKQKFGIKYVIDMQDPWHTDYYLKKPKQERPQKFWFSYYLNKFLEPIAMKSVDGIIAVSDKYTLDLISRYSNINIKNTTVIPFGAFEKDFEILNQNVKIRNTIFEKKEGKIDICYVGRGGHDMSYSFVLFCEAIAIVREKNKNLFDQLRCFFVGTSYARAEFARGYFDILAEKYELQDFFKEYPARVPYFEGLKILKDADLLFVPGSDDPGYTASKIYPYIMSKKPLIAVFNHQSSVKKVIEISKSGSFVGFDQIEKIPNEQLVDQLYTIIIEKLTKNAAIEYDLIAFEPYMAKSMTQKQCQFFDHILINNQQNFQN